MRIKELFPDLTEEQIIKAITSQKDLIRSRFPIKGETTMTFKEGAWVCKCGHKEEAYRTYCGGCLKNNITLSNA